MDEISPDSNRIVFCHVFRKVVTGMTPTIKKDTMRPVAKSVIQPPRIRSLAEKEERCVKILCYGKSGTGKTRMLYGLLKAGLKIFVISTDVGGEGLNSVYGALRDDGSIGTYSANLRFVELQSYDHIQAFCKNPGSIYPEIYKFDPDFLAWDGFSGFQQVQLADYIAAMTPARSEAGKEISDGRESGLLFEQTDWGMVRNGTVRNLSRFLGLDNAETGKKWHKLVTALEQSSANKTEKQQQSLEKNFGEDLERMPLVQGAAASLIAPAFDLILETRAIEKRDGVIDYKYYTKGHDRLFAKCRGIKLEKIEEADMEVLWKKIKDQL